MDTLQEGLELKINNREKTILIDCSQKIAGSIKQQITLMMGKHSTVLDPMKFHYVEDQKSTELSLAISKSNQQKSASQPLAQPNSLSNQSYTTPPPNPAKNIRSSSMAAVPPASTGKPTSQSNTPPTPSQGQRAKEDTPLLNNGRNARRPSVNSEPQDSDSSECCSCSVL